MLCEDILNDNAMIRHRPDLFYEWNTKKNDEIGLNVYKTTRGSGKKAWWTCPDCKSDYQATVKNRVNGNNCPYCRGYMVNHTNSLASLSPEFSSEWHPVLNGELTPHDVVLYSAKKVWWMCNHCEHEWETQVQAKTKGSKCPGCSEYRLSNETSLAAKLPELAKQWHQTKNGDSSPNDVTLFSSLKIWWVCEEEHEWKSKVNYRADGGGCPYCSNRKLLKGFNDMWTTNSQLASLLANKNDGYKFTQSSEKKVDWKCLDCDLVIKSRKINQIKNYGLSCPRCSDGKSFPEKVMYSMLLQLQVNFVPEKTFKWLKDKRYDFYLPDYDMIIEVHGSQHYIEGFKHFHGGDLEEVQENDYNKETTARLNGIKEYIAIDCSLSELSFIQQKIEESDIAKTFDLSLVDWVKCAEYACSSMIKEICLFYDSNKVSLPHVSKVFKLSVNAVSRYLKKGTEIGWCTYLPSSQTRTVVKLSKEGLFIEEFNSIKEASVTKSRQSNIISCCRGRNKTAYGYKWMYLEDYEELIDNAV